MSTYNIWFHGKNRKNIFWTPFLSEFSLFIYGIGLVFSQAAWNKPCRVKDFFEHIQCRSRSEPLLWLSE